MERASALDQRPPFALERFGGDIRQMHFGNPMRNPVSVRIRITFRKYTGA
jgi:hypothetical protein